VSALRTPVCKAKRGGFKDTHADDLLAAVLKATLQQTGVEPQVLLRVSSSGQNHITLCAVLT